MSEKNNLDLNRILKIVVSLYKNQQRIWEKMKKLTEERNQARDEVARLKAEHAKKIEELKENHNLALARMREQHKTELHSIKQYALDIVEEIMTKSIQMFNNYHTNIKELIGKGSTEYNSID